VKTRVLKVDSDEPSSATLAEAADVLAQGGLVAFATETVYGLGAIATDPSAVSRIYAAKGRPSFNPLIVHVADSDQAKRCVGLWPVAAGRLASRFWPGALTLVLPRASIIPPIVTGGRATIAVRVPAPLVARALIERVGQPLAAPSANRSNRVSPTCAEHVLADLDGRIDLVLDSGPTQLGLESTVLDLTSSPLRILRPGPIGPAEIATALGGSAQVQSARLDLAGAEDAGSPGMQPVHYAPRTPAWRAESDDELRSIDLSARTAMIVVGERHLDTDELPTSLFRVELPDPLFASRELYAVFHRLDALGFSQIVVVMPPDSPAWTAVRDRLIRATRPLAS
jgi:L-threonylcarbamoyladenylate synthase